MVSLTEFSLRALMLAISFYGYLQYLRKHIRIELAISLMFSAIGCAVFVAGLVNMLQEMTLAIFVGGLYLAYRSVREKESPFRLLTPGICFFLMGCIFLLYLIYGRKFDIYDDFSHWATAAKAVAQCDRFPNASNTDIAYTSYPLGSISFIYYITKILGISSEWIQCLAQNILILSMAVSVFAFANGVYGVIVAAIVCVCMMVCNSAIVTLCVDTLLTVTAVGAFSFCLYYREEIQDKIWYLLPYTVFLLAIKNSGVLFVIFLYVYIAYCFRKTNTSLVTLLVHGLLTFAVLYCWQKHVNQVYADGMMSRHSLSLSYCIAVFTEKSQGELQNTIRLFMENTFTLSNKILYLIAVGFPLLLVTARVLKVDTSLTKQMYGFTFVYYCAYQVGLLGMYLFNMPTITEELLSYARYHDIMIDLAAGVFCICALSVMSQRKVNGNPHILRLLIAAAATAVLVCVINPFVTYYIRYSQPTADRHKLDTLIENYNIQKDRRYFILVSNERQDAGYLEYMAQYLLEPRDLEVCSPATMEDWLEYNCLKHFDYFVLFEKTPETVQFFEDNFQSSENVICKAKY